MPNTTQQVAYQQRYNNFVDGFAINTAVIPNRYSYQDLALNAMGALRLANNYRPRIYAVPDQSAFGLTGMVPFSDFMTQIRALPGTIITGMTLCVLNFGTDDDVALALTDNLYISVEDEATGIPFFSDWAAELMFNSPTLYTDTAIGPVSTYVSKTAWLPLTRPRPLVDSGVVTVKMSYKATPGTSGNIAPQLLLICAEPCAQIRQTLECA